MKSRSYPGPEVTGFALRGSRIKLSRGWFHPVPQANGLCDRIVLDSKGIHKLTMCS